MVPLPDIELDGASWHPESDASVNAEEIERRQLMDEHCRSSEGDHTEIFHDCEGEEPAPEAFVPLPWDASLEADDESVGVKVKVERSKSSKRRRLTGKQTVDASSQPPPIAEPAPKSCSKPTAKSSVAKKRAKPGAQSPAAKKQARRASADVDVTYAEIQAMPLLQVPMPAATSAAPVADADDDPPMYSIYSSDECPQLIDSSGTENDEPKNVNRLPKNVNRRESDCRASHYGLSGGTFRNLLRMGAPAFLFNAIMALFLCQGLTDHQDLNGAEMFSGVAAIHRAFEARGFSSAKYDQIIDSTLCDILTPSGWSTGLQLCRRLQPNSLMHFATVCSTWVFMSRHTTKRSPWAPLSPEPWSACVSRANCMVSRVCLFWFLLVASGCTFVLEQPSSSYMALHPRIEQFRASLTKVKQRWHHTHLWMGMYGAPTQKPTRCFSNNKNVVMLHNVLDKSKEFESNKTTSVNEERKSQGLSCINGNKAGLEESQAYPEGYGERVCELYEHLQAHPTVIEESDESSATPDDPEEDQWTDAWSEEICSFLAIRRDKMMV